MLRRQTDGLCQWGAEIALRYVLANLCGCAYGLASDASPMLCCLRQMQKYTPKMLCLVMSDCLFFVADVQRLGALPQ